MSWFWFLAFLLMLAWNAFLMRINSMQADDVRRLQRYAAEVHALRHGGLRSLTGGGR